MPVVGSPEWFHEKSQTEDMQNWMRTVEEKREIFLDYSICSVRERKKKIKPVFYVRR